MNIAPISMSTMAMKKASFKGPDKVEPVRTEEVKGGKVDYFCLDGKIYPVVKGDKELQENYEFFKKLRGIDQPQTENRDFSCRAKAGTAEEM